MLAVLALAAGTPAQGTDAGGAARAPGKSEASGPPRHRLTYDVAAYELSQRLQREPGLDLAALMRDLVARLSERVGETATLRHVGGTAFEVEVTGDAGRVAAVRARVENLGKLELMAVATDGSPMDGVVLDLAKERQRLQAWLDAGGRQRVREQWRHIEDFHAAEQGPIAGAHLRWSPHLVRRSAENPARWSAPFGSIEGSSLAAATVRVFDDAEWNGGRVPDGAKEDAFLLEFVALNRKERSFGNEHLDARGIALVADDAGRPAVQYCLKPEFAAEYGDWSQKLIRQHAAIVLNGEIRSAPMILSRIPGRGQIAGLERGEAEALAACLSAGEIPFTPVLLRQQLVPPR